jgi:hypothetical protein
MKRIQVDTTAGKEYGGVSGHHYHDVDVVLRRTAKGTWVAEATERWGSNQGHLEEHGRKEIAARGTSLDGVVQEALRRAEAANIEEAYVTQAISRAELEASEEEEALEEEETRRPKADLSRFTVEELLAEIRLRRQTPLNSYLSLEEPEAA